MKIFINASWIESNERTMGVLLFIYDYNFDNLWISRILDIIKNSQHYANNNGTLK